MNRRGFCLWLLASPLLTGCNQQLFPNLPRPFRPPPPGPPNFSYYHLNGWDWQQVQRVVVLPFLNETQTTRVAEEVQQAMIAELQRLGRFEVIPAPPDDQAVLSACVRRGGRFDEAVLLHLARLSSADVIVHGIVSHYSLYPRPRLGLVLQAIAPQEGKVVASVDGLWDAMDATLAERCRAFYRQRPRPLPPFIRNHVIPHDYTFADELALDSPTLFQRWVCWEASRALLGYRVPGVAYGSDRQPAPLEASVEPLPAIPQNRFSDH
ncbi:MAG: hypothetical protein NZ703_03585 [Gemmataceae bacterium]|nr:hypothetical protein [Gemmataceae bacterium]